MQQVSKWFLVDIESTGVSANDKVCEVAIVEIDDQFNVVSKRVSLINPGMPINPAAGAVNGITDAMVACAPTLEEYMASAGNPLMQEGGVFIAHSAAFDYRFLKNHVHPEAKVLCTLKCARALYPNAENHKQATLAYMLGLNLDRSKAHSADGDLDVLLQLVQRMCSDHNLTLPELLELQTKPLKITTMKFGKKHYGKKLEDVPKDYISWMLKSVENLDPDLRAALEAL